MTNPVPKATVNNEHTTRTSIDIYRETPLRYLGYAGHLGWLFRSYVPFKIASMVSVAYVCADVFDKTSATAASGASERQILSSATDAFLWHFLATFTLPTIFLHGINCVACSAENSSLRRRRRSRHVLPMFFGTLAIPLIAKPIDRAVDDFMSKPLGERLSEVMFRKADIDVNDFDAKDDSKKPKYTPKWFFDATRDLDDAEIERYHQKANAAGRQNASQPNRPIVGTNDPNQSAVEGSQGNKNATDVNEQEENSNENEEEPSGSNDPDGLHDKAIQADKTTEPPRPPKPPKPN